MSAKKLAHIKILKSITIETKKEIIAKREGGVRVSDLAKEYDLAKSTICTILKNKDVFKKADVSKGVTRLTNQRPQVLQEVEKMLLVWINENGFKGSTLSGGLICGKALEFYQQLLENEPNKKEIVEEFKASRGWFKKFCRRIGINRESHEDTNSSDHIVEEIIIEDSGGKNAQMEIGEAELRREDGAQGDSSAQWWRKIELVSLPAIATRAEGGDEASLQSRDMSIDSRLLIKQVEARPALWNRYDGGYCQKQVVSKLWAEIAGFHGVHELRVKNKWKALRDTFRQELKKSSQPTMWSFYQDMSFLKGHLKTLQGRELEDQVRNESEEGDEEEDDRGRTIIDIKTEPEDNSIFLEEYNEEAESMGFGGEEQHKQTEEPKNQQQPPPEEIPESDDDYHFLMSFLPEMKRLTPKKKMMLRIKMMALFYNEIYRE